MFIAETIALGAVAVQFLLPNEMGITLSIGNRILAVPIRWVVPLVLIAFAGVLSAAALVAMYWRLAHLSVPAAGQ